MGSIVTADMIFLLTPLVLSVFFFARLIQRGITIEGCETSWSISFSRLYSYQLADTHSQHGPTPPSPLVSPPHCSSILDIKLQSTPFSLVKGPFDCRAISSCQNCIKSQSVHQSQFPIRCLSDWTPRPDRRPGLLQTLNPYTNKL